ncbi:hypothetical protein A5886_002841 [Enterococcus sp. 8G7_MSG3316]|uniref:Deoxyribose-phosphate aldolase n=1 Tax=Candidatus Enterococcus testudinis TaxID=1834191 RepID=A0A242AA31_9ENTE|nr:deoxyribose-phosphate aldolase [Enterococcus sp. 8G7_MSG3316]OTN77740.1 hypothetical protein A5886_002841 [Enterococcus sp. 8G7_MSG3316]
MDTQQRAVSYRLLAADLTDWHLKDAIIYCQQGAVDEIVVLPSAIRRAKQLAQTSDLQIGGVIDYPLAQGTMAKVAFEMGRAFMDGADFLEVWLPSSVLLDNSRGFEELIETIRSLTLSGGEVRLGLQTESMNELTKIQVAQQLKARNWPSVVLGQGTPLADAIHDVTLFALDGGPQLSIQSNPEGVDAAAYDQLIEAGAAKVSIPFANMDSL